MMTMAMAFIRVNVTTLMSVAVMFRLYDSDGNGILDASVSRLCILTLQLIANNNVVQRAFSSVKLNFVTWSI